MIPLTAREVLGHQVEQVTATMRPSEREKWERGSGLCVVFGEEDGAFLGLVTEQTCVRFPNRIFADLLAGPRPAPVAAETPIEAVYNRMAAEGVETLPVLDENGAFLGVITRPSLLEALLRREREMLAEARWLQGQLEAEQKRLVAWSQRQEELNQASRALLSLVGQTAFERELLQETIRALATLLQARYGAIGILDEANGLQQFIFTGLTPEEVDRIGEHPRGRGLLGVVIRENQVLRLADLTQDSRHAGFPAHHPPMKSLLAMPIEHQGQVYGRVYLCDKTTGEPFTEDDERLAVSFARSLALAVAHARELAERKRAEEALQASELWLRAIFNSQDDAVLVVTPDRTILDMNMAAQRMFGYSVEEVKNRSTEILHVDRQHYVEFGERIQAAFAREELARLEFQAKRKNGEIFPTEHTVSLLKNHLGEPIGIVSVVRDITERKRAEEALRKSEETHRKVVQNINEIVYAVRTENDPFGGTVQLVGDQVENIIGYRPDEFLQDPGLWFRLIHPDDVPAVAETTQKMFARKEPVTRMYRVRHKETAEYRWMEDKVVPQIDDRGNIIGIFGVARDITERMRAEKELKRTLSLLNATLESTADGILVVDLTGKIVSYNGKFAGMWRIPDTVLTSHSDNLALEFVLEQLEDPEGFLRKVRQLYDTPDANSFDTLRFKDGRMFERYSQPQRIGDKIAGRVWSFRDVTVRRRSEEALREGEERFRNLVQELDAIVWEADAATWKFTFVSQRAEAMLGYPIEQWLTEPDFWINHIHPDDREQAVAFCRDCTLEGRDHDFEYRSVAADGRVVWLRDIVRVIQDAKGRARHLRGLMVDVTEPKRMEETLHALYQAGLAVQEPMGLEDRLARLLQTARDVLHLDRLSILLADPEGRWLEGVPTLGTKEPAEAMRVPIGPEGGGLAHAYLSQQPVIWADSQAPVPEAIRLQHPYNRLEAFRSRAFAILPLVVQGRAIGVMGADRKHTRRPIEPALLPLLQLFAGQAAIAIENSRLFEQVQDGRERLRTLSHQLVEIQEAERQHIARELHDEIGQALTGLKLSLEISKHVPPDAIRPRLDEALELVNELMAHARDLSLDLRPAMLDDLGLLPTLLWHFDRYTAQTGIQVTFKHTGLERRFASEVETAAYRIVQEALTNVARHAGVNEVMVRLWADQDKLEARIEDHGAGFDPRAALATSATSGLAGMRERAVSLGGQLTVESSPGIGTHLTGEFPLGASVERRERKRDAQDGDRAGG